MGVGGHYWGNQKCTHTETHRHRHTVVSSLAESSSSCLMDFERWFYFQTLLLKTRSLELALLCIHITVTSVIHWDALLFCGNIVGPRLANQGTLAYRPSGREAFHLALGLLMDFSTLSCYPTHYPICLCYAKLAVMSSWQMFVCLLQTSSEQRARDIIEDFFSPCSLI